MNTHKTSDALRNFNAVPEIEICKNQLTGVNFLFTIDLVPPLIIGKGTTPLIWLSARKPGTFSWFYLVIENKSFNPEIIVTIEKSSTIIKDKSGQVIINAEKVSDSKIVIKDLDLRIIGFNVYCENNHLCFGNEKFTETIFTSQKAALNFLSPIEVLYRTILERFPMGREASYLLNNQRPDPEIVRQNLQYIMDGKDSDRRYLDDYSKLDAKNFLIALDAILAHPQPPSELIKEER